MANDEEFVAVVSRRLSQARASAGITQVEAAARAECTQEAISQYESGRRIPRLPLAVRLAQAYGRSMDDLYGVG